jgi:hypothetical protein
VEKQEIGICYECSTKNMDSSKKVVYQCNICRKWFCEQHSKPKLPYFIDWETQFDVQGEPAVKAFFYSEYGRQDGHADFIYLRNTIEDIEIKKKEQDRVIREKIDKMAELGSHRSSLEILVSSKKKKVYRNAWGNRFTVPKEVYSNKVYREKLDGINDQSEINGVLYDYYFYGKTVLSTEKRIKQLTEKQKKKHWWQ